MKKFLQNALQAVSRPVGMLCMALAALCVLSAFTGSAMATGDDISGVVDSLSGYWTAIKVVAIGVVLFVLGRKLIKKL